MKEAKSITIRSVFDSVIVSGIANDRQQEQKRKERDQRTRANSCSQHPASDQRRTEHEDQRIIRENVWLNRQAMYFSYSVPALLSVLPLPLILQARNGR